MEHIKALYHLVLAILAVMRYGYPARSLIVIAVTGTSGKTTVSHLIYSVLKQAGKKVSLVSSISTIIGNREYDTGLHVTTPSPFALQKFLQKAKKTGNQYVVIEASSHGIAQFRMLGTNVMIGVLTNIAHEHLDWHKTFTAYANAKLSLIAKAKVAIVNKNDQSYSLLLKYKPLSAKIITFSLTGQADFNFPKMPTVSGLPGDYNKENMLAAAAVCTLLGITPKNIASALLKFKGLNGRFEEIDNHRGYRIIVDFAHKPNALEALLKTLRKMTKKRLIIMFGSAGERDKAKRQMMGMIAAKYADISVLTAEDPRSEEVNDIIDEIAKGYKKTGGVEGKRQTAKSYFIKMPERAEAINYIINNLACKDDLVAFLGKSHEKSMCYGKVEYPWNEHEEIIKALAKT